MLDVSGLSKSFGAIQALNSVDVRDRDRPHPRHHRSQRLRARPPCSTASPACSKPDAGTVAPRRRGHHRRPARHASPRKGIRRTFQAGKLVPGLTVLENVMSGVNDPVGARRAATRPCGCPSSARRRETEIRERAETVLRLVGHGGQRPSAGRPTWCGPSGSSCRSRARSSPTPKLLLLDEPASGMGAEGDREGRGDHPRGSATTGVTVVVVSHDVKMLMNLSDLVTVLNFGEKIAEGVPGRGPEGPPGAGGLPWRRVTIEARSAAAAERTSRCPTATSTR